MFLYVIEYYMIIIFFNIYFIEMKSTINIETMMELMIMIKMDVKWNILEIFCMNI